MLHLRLYKEGQGTWARGSLAATVGIIGLLAASKAYDVTSASEYGSAELFAIPVFNWSIQPAVFLAFAAVIPFMIVGYWSYNHKRMADFLIETELELKTKVTWPTRKEALNNSFVVIIGTIIMGIWIVLWDKIFFFIQNMVYDVKIN